MAANKVPAIRHILLVVFTLLAIATATSHISNTAHFDTGLLTGLIGLIATANLIAYALTRTHIFISNSLFGLLLGLTLNHYLAISLTDYQSPFFWSGEHHLSLLVHLTMGLALLSCELWLRTTLSSPRPSVAIRLAAAVLAISLLASIALAEQRLLWQSASVFVIYTLFNAVFGLSLWRQGTRVGLSYCLGWGLILVTWLLLILVALEQLKLAPTVLVLGCALSLGWLALSFIIDRIQKHQAAMLLTISDLELALEACQQQTEQFVQQEDETEQLEYKVQERTLELEIALRELSEKNQELEEKNTLDALTEIRNRSYFDKKYLAELRRSRREQTQLSIVMLDIDHFKQVNDNYGHLVGDECIKTVADMITQALKRPSDEVCRYGGEEFAIILPNTDLKGAITLVENIRTTIADAQIDVESSQVSFTVSAGIATTIASLTDEDEALLSLADKQLYKAKETGRNKVLGSELTRPTE